MRWNPRLFFLFFAPYLFAVAAVALTVALYADRALEQQYLQTLADEVLHTAQVAGNALPWDSVGETFDRRCRELASTAQVRLTVIQPDGRVLCDSQATSANLENHLHRPEVQDALRGGSGQDVRLSASVRQRLFYRAWLQRNDGGERIVRVAVPLATVTKAQEQIRYILVLSLLVAAGVGLWPTIRRSQWLSRRINDLVEYSVAVAGDREPPPLAPERRDELGRLEANLAAMGRAVNARLRATREEEEKLRAVLAGMVEGVVVVGQRGELVLLNERALRIFGINPAQEYKSHRLVEICRDPELQQLARDTIQMPATAAPLAREITIAADTPRVLAVNAAPVQGDAGPLGYVLVFHDITELKRLEAVRRDFVANVSHELRTPLTAIRGYAETLLAGASDDPETARKFLAVIERNSERLTRLIDDLLVLSDLELGRMGLQRGAVPVLAAVAAAFDVVGEKARRGAVTLRQEGLGEVPPVDGDSDRVEQVFVNLVDNAVKYTPRGGAVTVSARRVADAEHGNGGASRAAASGNGDYVEVAISDTGIGIPSQDLPRLTERFYRVDKARSRELGGTGLGLAIVKHIVQAHGGWMRIESELGKGTTVRVTFPTAASKS